MLLKRVRDSYFVDGNDVKSLVEEKKLSPSFLGEYYSPSFISSFYACPAKQLLLNLDKKDFIEPLVIGTCVHYLLEQRFLNGGVSDKDLEYIDKKLRNDSSLKEKTLAYYNAYFKIKDDYKDYQSFTEREIVNKPTPLGVNIPKIKGIVDRIDISDTKKRVVDYKTSSRPVTSDKYIDQLTIYKWIVEEELGTDIDDVCAASLYTEDPKFLYPEITLRSQSQLIEKILNVDEEVLKSRVNNYYKVKKSYQCRFCKYFDKCNAGKDIEI